MGQTDSIKLLKYILTQARDDLDDLVSGLETGSLAYDIAATGAQLVLRSALDQLVRLPRSG